MRATRPTPPSAPAAEPAGLADGVPGLAVVEAFVRSLRALSDRMLGGRVTVSPPESRDRRAGGWPGGGPVVACAIDCTGELAGPVVLAFEPAAAELMARAFTGLTLTCGTPDFADAVGEIANMVVGAAKAALPHEARISTPTVTVRAEATEDPPPGGRAATAATSAWATGVAQVPAAAPYPEVVPASGSPATAEPHAVAGPGAGWVVIPCRTPAGPFEVAVGVRDRRPADGRAA